VISSDSVQAQSIDLFAKAVAAMAAMTGKPLLYGPNGKALAPTSNFTYRRDAAKNVGSFKNWRPQAVFTNQAEALEREAIVARSIDLSNNDPHASGIIDNFATTVIGSGLVPDPTIDRDALPGMSKDEARALQKQMRAVYGRWSPYADAALRMHDGQIQYLEKLSLMRYGEFFKLLPMIDDPLRPYMLACQLIHPLRVKTPLDKINDPRIRDGIELGDYGQAVAIWVKKSGQSSMMLTDTSANFLRIPMRRGHRINVIHGFICKEPEQVRGWPFLAPAMKYLRDMNDLLSAELVSNVVTAALTYFIETSGDPYQLAANMTTHTDTYAGQDGSSRTQRYQETYPGAILYGSSGEKPHLLAANRPGTTFEPFVKTVKKSISMAANLPYVVNFKDVEGTNFAGFRAAMLDAWRVFEADRLWHARISCQPVFTMLMEEAFLRGEIDYPSSFYRQRHALTFAEWHGSPKGDIEPVKAATADKLLIESNLKTRTKATAERGGNFRANVETLEEEQELLEAAGLLDDNDDDEIDIPDDVYPDGSNGDDGYR
jgi:lambda family phage portal protein